MNKYENGKIYKIVSKQTPYIYIGSTHQPITNRLSGHKSQYKLWKNGKCAYLTSFKIVQYDDVEIILIENYPCNNKEELEIREKYYIQTEPYSINNKKRKKILDKRG